MARGRKIGTVDRQTRRPQVGAVVRSLGIGEEVDVVGVEALLRSGRILRVALGGSDERNVGSRVDLGAQSRGVSVPERNLPAEIIDILAPRAIDEDDLAVEAHRAQEAAALRLCSLEVRIGTLGLQEFDVFADLAKHRSARACT